MAAKRKPRVANVKVVGRSILVLQPIHGKTVGPGVAYVASVVKPTGAKAPAKRRAVRRRKK